MNNQISYKRLDEDFEAFLESVEIEVTDSDLTPEKRIERRKLADEDEFQFCTIYFPKIFDEPFNEMH